MPNAYESTSWRLKGMVQIKTETVPNTYMYIWLAWKSDQYIIVSNKYDTKV